MRGPLFVALLMLGAAPAFAAEEPSGCDKFKWPIERERAALTAPDRIKLASGAEITALPPKGITLALSPPANAGLPSPPERTPKEGTFVGFATFKNALPPGRYTISLSAAGWIDVVQDGQFLKSVTSSGVRDCEGIRKSVKFEIPPKPFTVQISGAESNSISLAIVPASE
jgi:hypothetical protein